MPTSPVFAAEHTVATVCPLDCPDSCSLDVTVQEGKVVAIDGSHANPVTGGYICAKVRRFGERLYGTDRLLFPAIRKGPKGLGQFTRTSWDDALALIAERMLEARAQWGGEDGNQALQQLICTCNPGQVFVRNHQGGRGCHGGTMERPAQGTDRRDGVDVPDLNLFCGEQIEK